MTEKEFKPRLSKPEKGNPYYNTKGNGGYSTACKGSPCQSGLNVISNCVGWAIGRFNEIAETGSKFNLLKPVNAENFMNYKGSLESGMEPRLGACMVWAKGKVGVSSDGCGHVCIVEKINVDGSIVTSESGWQAKKPFWTQTRKKGSDGNWGQGKGYTFLGFIYNPAVNSDTKVSTSGSTIVKPTTTTPSTAQTSTTFKEVKATGTAKSKDTSLSGSYTTTTGLYLRNDAGTANKALVLLPKGTVVKNYGYYTESGNVKWMYIKTTYNGVTYCGFCSSTYLKKQ